MCGILGILNLSKANKQLNLADLTEISHRGPDGQGIYQNEMVSLGHCRLSILDLSESSHQPMLSSDERYCIVYNGEIYNYIEIREQLTAEGYQFLTSGDTEVVLLAYAYWGKECLQYFRGMFTFAIWDSIKKELFIARDRCGEKPFIYYQDKEIFIFASEFKALTSLLPDMPLLNPSIVDMYLHYQYVPEPFSLLENVSKLPAASFAYISLKHWPIQIKKYWDLEEIPPNRLITEQDIRNEIENSIKLTLRSDVPVAVALSGGIDSGVIAALAQKHYGKPMHAFSVGYPGRPQYDERNKAKALAKTLGCIFHELELPTEKFVSFFPDFAMVLDEPVADIAAFGHYFVPKAASDEGIKVLLTGIGGDELFWGYDWTRIAASLNQKNVTYQRMSLLFAPFLKLPYFYILFSKASRSLKISRPLREFLRKIIAVYDDISPDDQHIFMGVSDQASVFSKTTKGNKHWYGSAMDRVNSSNAFTPTNIGGLRKVDDIPIAIQKILFDTWLVSNCLTLGDRVSMSNSVESRLPFLDYKLIEMVVAKRKVTPDHNLGQKTVLRRILQDILPPEVLNRPKAGFQPPVTEWYQGIIEKYGEKVAGGNLVKQNIIDSKAFEGYFSGKKKSIEKDIFYRLILLEYWYEGLKKKHETKFI